MLALLLSLSFLVQTQPEGVPSFIWQMTTELDQSK